MGLSCQENWPRCYEARVGSVDCRNQPQVCYTTRQGCKSLSDWRAFRGQWLFIEPLHWCWVKRGKRSLLSCFMENCPHITSLINAANCQQGYFKTQWAYISAIIPQHGPLTCSIVPLSVIIMLNVFFPYQLVMQKKTHIHPCRSSVSFST